ncbi:phage-related protein [Haloactinopolyspora alba]|uniref:Phage-related protein n=1 Tax=Haloactinopolyspora alba TaxID=648780 RepID=A0A2P8E3Y8_9ACTN|nr:hypothetical protein [Haloactinopolyspora alba]PSL04137.1 phage-related protein [Haloactinopolyspora alba]
MADPGVVIGKVSVKVFPDTSAFRKNLKGQLKKIEKSTDAINVKVDAGDALRELERTTREMQAEIRESDLTAQVNVDGEKAQADARAATKRIQDQIKKIKLEYDADDRGSLQEAIDRINEELRRLDLEKLEVELDRDSLDAARELLEEEIEDKPLRFEVEETFEGYEKLRKQIDALVDQPHTVNVEVDADQDSLREFRDSLDDMIAQGRTLDLRVAMDNEDSVLRAISQIDTELDKIRHPEVDLSVNYSEQSLQAMRDEMVAELESRPIQFSAEDNIEGLRKLRQQVDELVEKKTIEFEIARDQGSLNDFRDQLDELIEEYEGEQIELEPDVADPAYREAQAELAYLSRSRVVELIPRVSQAAALRAATSLSALSGFRVLGDYVQRLNRQILNLDKSIPILAQAALAIGTLGAAGLAGASNLFALSASLAQISGVALALPGIFAGVGIAMGTLIAVLQDAPEVLADVGDRFARLQNQLSDRFWSEAEQPIRNLIDTLFPQLAAGLRGTATALGGYFANLSGSLERFLDGSLEEMFDNLNESIDIAAEGTDAIASAIETLGTAGSSYLPRLAQWFVRISRQFDAWLTEAASDGRLQGWIDAGIMALADLGRVLRETGRILFGIAEAANAAGGSTLGSLADALERIADVVNGEPFQSKLVTVFEAAHKAMDNIADEAGPGLTNFFTTFADTLGVALPQIGRIVGRALGGIADALARPEFQRGLTDFLDGVEEGVNGLLPALGPVADALGALGSLAGQLAAVIGPILGEAFTILAGIIERLAPVLEPVVALLGAALLQVLQALGPVLLQVADALAVLITTGLLPALIAMLPVLVDLFTMLATTVLPIVAQLLRDLAPILAQLFTTLASALEKVLPLLGPIVEFLTKFFAQTLLTLVEGATQAIQGALDVITGIFDVFAGIFTGDWKRVWEGIKKIFSGVWDVIVGLFKVWMSVSVFRIAKAGMRALKGLFKGAWNGIKGLFSSALGAVAGIFRGAWGGIRSFFSGALSNIRGIASGALNGLVGLFRRGLSRLGSAVTGGLGRVKNFFGDLKDDVLGLFANAGSWLWDSGRSLIEGFGDGMKSAFDSVTGSVGGFLGGLRDYFPFSPAKKGPFSGKGWVFYSGQSIGSGLADGILASQREAEKAAQRLAQSAYPALPSLQPDSAEFDDGATAGNITIYQTNHNPQAQPASEQVNDSLQVAAALGL